MSYFSDLTHGRITFSQFVTKSAGWAQALTAKDATLAAAAGAALSIVKQGASDAIMIADTALGAHILPAADAVEAALDAALAGATGGVSVPFNPIIDSAIDQMAGVVKKAADAWALQAKAKLAAPPVPQ